ncbi:MAG: toprim domain-containing protein [Methanothrix sp.]|nr:toprim domain-containing protein [Methanothrix sp.]
MDLLALNGYGFRNVVASLGTALTSEQVRLLKRVCSRIILGFDSDEAGEKAVLRNAPAFLHENIHVSVVVLSPDDDPDDFINREGRESFLQKIQAAPSLMDFCLDVLLKKGKDTIPQQLSVIDGFKPLYEAVGNELEKSRSVKTLAEKLGHDESIILRSLAPRQRPVRHIPLGDLTGSSLGERFILSFFLRHHQECGNELMDACLPDLFENQKIAGLLQDAFEDFRLNGKVDLDRLTLRHPDADTQRLLADISICGKETEESNTLIILRDILNKFKKKSLKQRATELRGRIAEAEKKNDQELLQALLAEKEELIRQQAMKL